VGHPNFQHPERLREGTYSRDVDRFPLLVVATALRALVSGGRALWERYDNGDNLLFKESDLAAPDKSALFGELQRISDPLTQKLTNRLRQACQARLEETAALDQLLPKEWFAAPARASGIKKGAAAAAVQGPDWDFDRDERPTVVSRPVRRKAGGVPPWVWIVSGTAAALVVVVGVILALVLGKGAKSEPSAQPVAQAPKEVVRPAPVGVGPKLNEKPQPPVQPPGVDPPPKVVDPAPEPQPVVVLRPGQVPLVKAQTFPGDAGLPIPEHRAVWTWENNQINIFERATGNKIGAQHCPGQVLAVAADHQHIFGVHEAGGKKSFEIWDRGTLKPVATLEGINNLEQSRFFGNPMRLFTLERQRSRKRAVFLLRPWDVATGQTIPLPLTEAFPPRLDHLSISPEGKLALTGGTSGGFHLWELASGKEQRGWVDMPGQRRVKEAAFTARGLRAVANAYNSREVTVWDMQASREICRFTESAPVSQARLSADGRRVLTIVNGRPLRVWNADTGVEIAQLEMDNPVVAGALFSPDSREVYTPVQSNGDRRIRVWQLPPVGPSTAVSKPGGVQYLADMPEFDVVKGVWELGKGNLNGSAIKVNGVLSPHGLGMHPRDNSFTRVKYKLGKAWSTFKAAVGINDTSPDGPKDSLTFEVWGDSKRLWHFTVVRRAGFKEGLAVDVRGVDILELRVVCPGPCEGAHAVWLEPLVTNDAEPGPMLTPLALINGKALINTALTPEDSKDAVQAGSYCKVYVLQANAGRQYRIKMASPVLLPWLRVQTADGRTLKEVKGRRAGASILINCRKPGTFQVIATTIADGATGPFTLSVIEANMPAEAAQGGAKDIDLTPAFQSQVRLPFTFLHKNAGLLPQTTVRRGTPVKTPVLAQPKWLRKVDTSVRGLVLHPNGKHFLYGDRTGAIYLADLATGQVALTLTGHAAEIRALAVSADGTRLLSGSMDRTARLWDLKTGSVLHQFLAHTDPVTSVALSADGKLALTRDLPFIKGRGDVYVWDTATGEQVANTHGSAESPLTAAAFFPDNRQILLATEAMKLQVSIDLWDPMTNARRPFMRANPISKGLPGRTRISQMLLSGDGERLVFPFAGAVAVVQTRQGLPVRLVNVETLTRSGFNLRPDGQYCLCCGGASTAGKLFDCFLHVISLKTGREVCRVTYPSAPIYQGAFTYDGRHVLSCTNSELMLWELPKLQ
jgi:WD40 repeat protein